MIISWSFLKAFEQCPFQQKLIRIDKVIPKKIDERRFITGTVGVYSQQQETRKHVTIVMFIIIAEALNKLNF
jgi:hypothetical protein